MSVNSTDDFLENSKNSTKLIRQAALFNMVQNIDDVKKLSQYPKNSWNIELNNNSSF